jgi:hypothetical protein
MPLSTSEFILTHRVVAGAVDAEPVAIAIRCIMEASPCGEDPGWSDLVMTNGEETTIATPFGALVPTSLG